MNTLIQNIAHQAGINEEKARIALVTVSTHMKQRFPALQSVFELILEDKESFFTNDKIPMADFSKKPICLN
jgi:hypothetical protein